MSFRALYPEDQPGPRSEDPKIKSFFQTILPNGFRTFASLIGAPAGIYVAFYGPGGNVTYVGGFVALVSVIHLARWVYGYGRGLGATEHEIIQHEG